MKKSLKQVLLQFGVGFLVWALAVIGALAVFILLLKARALDRFFPKAEVSKGMSDHVQSQIFSLAEQVYQIQNRLPDPTPPESKDFYEGAVAKEAEHQVIQEKIIAELTKKKSSSVEVQVPSYPLSSFELPLSVWEAYPHRQVEWGTDDLGWNFTMRLQEKNNPSTWRFNYNEPGVEMDMFQVSPEVLEGPLFCDEKKYSSAVIRFARILQARYSLNSLEEVCSHIQIEKPLKAEYQQEERPTLVYRFGPESSTWKDRGVVVVASVGEAYGTYGFVVEWKSIASNAYALDEAETREAARKNAELMLQSFLKTGVQSICTNDYMGCS